MEKCGSDWSRGWAMVLKLLENGIWKKKFFKIKKENSIRAESWTMKKRQIHEGLGQAFKAEGWPRDESEDWEEFDVWGTERKKPEHSEREGQRNGLALESLVPRTSRKDPAHVRLNNPQSRLAFLLRQMGRY